MRLWRACLFTCAVAWATPALAVDKAQCLKAYESAQRHKQASELTAARTELLVCVEPACPEALRSDCTGWLADVDKNLPTVVFEVHSRGHELSDVRVIVDGKTFTEELSGTARPIDPGRHTFRFEAVDHPPVERTFTIHQGEKNRALAIEIPAAEEPSKRGASYTPSTLTYVLAGVGAVGLLSFSYFGVKGIRGRSDLASCKGSCSQDAVDSVHADFTRADVSLAIATVALGGAAYLYFQGRPTQPETRIGILARPTGVSTTVRVAF